MAKPQKENGYTGIANEICEALARIYLPARWTRILWIVFRFSYGFHRTKAYFPRGKLSALTGLKRQHLKRVLDGMKSAGIITVERVGYSYTITFNKDYESWSIVTPGGYEPIVPIKGPNRTHKCTTIVTPGGDDLILLKKRKKKKERAGPPSETGPATPDEVAKIRQKNFPKKPQKTTGQTCPNCQATAPDIFKGGKCPHCGKWV